MNWKRVAAPVVSVVLTLGFAELGLRLTGVKFDASVYGQDPVTGWRLRPSAEGWWVTENQAYVRINSAGMNDREYSPEKPPGVIRLAVLGDSMTAAVQVDREANYCRVLERELGGCEPFRGKRVELMNFGVPGFGTAQQLLQFRHQVIRYQPDAVILAFFSDNDVQNNHRLLNPVDSAKSPYFVLQDDELVLDDSFRMDQSRYYGVFRDSFGNLANRSRVVQLAAEVALRRGPLRQSRLELRKTLKRFGDPRAIIYEPQPGAEMQEAWRVTEALILALRKEVEQQGMKFWLLTLFQWPQHLPAQARQKVVAEFGIRDLFYPDRRLENLARRSGMRAVILAPQLAERTEEVHEPLTYKNQGHYTPAGHQVVGATLARALCKGL